MEHLIFILVSLTLLVGFLALTWYEGERGVRVLWKPREHLDRQVTRIAFILAHVNLGAFLSDEVRRLAARLGHDLVHLSLLAVRATERLLTRLVRRLRTHREIDTTPRESVREFVKTLSDFKGQLDETRPVREQESSEAL